MKKDIEHVNQAKKSFNQILAHPKYSDIIKDDAHLSLLLNILADGSYKTILDIGTGTGYLAFPLAEMFPRAQVYGIDIAETIIENNQKQVLERGIGNLCFQA